MRILEINQTDRAAIFQMIDAERQHQNKKWGTEFDRRNTPNDWVGVIAGYLGYAVTLPWNSVIFRTALLQVAALCVAALEQKTYAPRHYDRPNATTQDGGISNRLF